MDEAIVEMLDAHGDAIYRGVHRAHEKVSEFWTSDDDVARLPELEFSGMVTQLAKILVLDGDPEIQREPGASAQFTASAGKRTLRFRLHRARLKPGSDREAFGAEDLESPRLNKVSAHTKPDFLLLWVSEGGEFLGIFAVVPNGRLGAEPGTQTASYATVRGRRWRGARRLPEPEVLEVAMPRSAPAVPLALPPVEADVDLGIEPDESSRKEEKKKLG